MTNEEIAAMYRDRLMSLPLISAASGIPQSRVRSILLSFGVTMRGRADGVRLRRDVLGKHLIGITREITPEWRENIRRARLAHADKNASGKSKKPSGYVEFTRGKNKNRSEHVVAMECRLGRKILPDECVHHIDGDRQNNEPNNLALVTRSGHTRLHRREQRLQKGIQ